MRFLLLILSMFVLGKAANSQTRLYVRPVVGTYDMHDMKTIQDGFAADFNLTGLAVKTVMSFPPSLQIEAGVDFKLGEFRVGPYLNYSVTKGKVSYSDYSGSLSINQNLYRVMLGGKFTGKLSKELNFYANLAVSNSALSIFQETTVPVSDDNDDLNFHSFGVSLEPGLLYSFPFGRSALQVNAGYEIKVYQSRTIYNSDTDVYLLNGNSGPAYLNWAGVRCGVGFVYSLRKTSG